MNITRKQLKEFGASDYLVKRLTKPLQPVGKKRCVYEYDLSQVLGSIGSMMDIPKIRKNTKALLAQLEVEVSKLVANPVTNKGFLEALQDAANANAQFEQTAHQARKIAKEFQNYKAKRGSDFSPRNNIVVFTS